MAELGTRLRQGGAVTSACNVLSDAGTIVASDVKNYLSSDAIKILSSISVSKFNLNAKEIEFDGVAKDGALLNYVMSRLYCAE